MRAEDLDREVRALASALGHVCFSLTEDLHGCRQSRLIDFLQNPKFACRACALCRRASVRSEWAQVNAWLTTIATKSAYLIFHEYW